jgi:4-amino-4-deoxy-L-arabinose transferase-like glycosyltransferase
MNCRKLRVNFLLLWSALLLAKLFFAVRLPLFVDEAFYAWEGRELAWSYSDLPGLTAWLTRLGTELFGPSEWALRLPFIAIGAAIPWLVRGLAARWFGEAAGWWAGILAMLMPLAGWLGVLALPDVPLVFAALLCLEGIARCRERVTVPALCVLAAGLALGALSHYRFAAVLIAGLVGLGCDARSRALCRDTRFLVVIALAALAWLPLLLWNLQHAGAGLRFQWLERHPWSFHADGFRWPAIQALVLTPPLFVLLLATARRIWRERRSPAHTPWRLLAGVASVSVAGIFLLGFFADRARVSFHWPLAGWLALTTAAPLPFLAWPKWARTTTLASAAIGQLLCAGWLSLAAVPSWRAQVADTKAYPAGFAGWREVAAAVRAEPGWREARLLADNFALAAQLAFALQSEEVGVLDHPRNRKHGRAEQLRAWGRRFDPSAWREGGPILLVVEDSASPMKQRLTDYHARCAAFAALPLPRVLNVDHGRKRFLLYRLDPRNASQSCAAPALAWIDAPASGATVAARFAVRGWAFKDGAGIGRVEVLVDGKPMGEASYGWPMPNVAGYWQISSDPAHPRVGFRAEVDAGGFAPGRHWVGLRLYGRDGAVEDWPEQAIGISAAAWRSQAAKAD